MKRILQKTPLEVGNFVAWSVLAAALAFAAGWIAATERLWGFCLGG